MSWRALAAAALVVALASVLPVASASPETCSPSGGPSHALAGFAACAMDLPQEAVECVGGEGYPTDDWEHWLSSGIGSVINPSCEIRE